MVQGIPGWGTRIGVTLFAAGLALVGMGCPSEPLADDQANDILNACCAEATERVVIAKDVESQEFRDRCGRCKQGASKSGCESAAKKVQDTVRLAYGDALWPTACVTMRSQLAEVGVSIPEVR